MFANALTQTFSALFSAPLLPLEAGASAGSAAVPAGQGNSVVEQELRSAYETPAHDLDQRVRASGEW
ncbi:hypothetical protein M4R22_01590 [Acidovorax sp. GBBC 3334]|uniref:hypothetical protein n=1 Tax=Acidovorax sp. GBBC 3334 TaxID=2940496 RepID=UPI002302530C|nr:hypothetical protein [Acidovorax sp. GBBC 3334]MDA8453445.1 hypothetical protein [Acidovorax sp. GBBC 3334]